MEGTNLTVGERCLISYKTELRTGDSHSIFDEDNQRINPSADVFVGDHIWIGAGSNVLKCSAIANDSVVGLGSTVTRRHTTPNVILLGSPAHEARTNIHWE